MSGHRKGRAMRRYFLFLLLAAIVFPVVQAGASVVMSLPTGAVIPMPAVNYFGSGPQTFGPGITWSSTNAFNGGGAVFGYTPGPCPFFCYSFLANGNWVGGLPRDGRAERFHRLLWCH